MHRQLTPYDHLLPAMNNKHIFAKLNAPYYVYAPPYLEVSGGIRAMHYFCHALNLVGEEAYVTTEKISTKLRTPVLTEGIQQLHRSSMRDPIVIYPEIVDGNPLGLRHIVRYLLNYPGAINQRSIKWMSTDLVFTHGLEVVPHGITAQLVQIPLINRAIYNTEGTEPGARKGSLLFLNRYLGRGGQLQEVTNAATEISFRVPTRSPKELSQLYRSAELLYTYEHSTACYEAMLCGCPVVYLPNPIMLKQPPEGHLGKVGWAWGALPEEVSFAKNTVAQVSGNYEAIESQFWGQLNAFICTTQERVANGFCTDEAHVLIPPINPIDQGIDFYNKRDLDEAMWLLLEAVNGAPEDPIPYAYIALICAARAQHAEADMFIRQALQLQPGRFDFVAALGEAYLKAGDTAHAFLYLDEAVRHQPTLYDAYAALAECLRLRGDTQKAIDLLQGVAHIPSRAQENIAVVLQSMWESAPQPTQRDAVSASTKASTPIGWDRPDGGLDREREI